MKFAELIKKIRTKDKNLLDDKGEYFNDSDFEVSSQEDGKPKDKKMTYKDVIRHHALKKMDGNDEDSEDSDSARKDIFKKGKTGETMAEEEARLKAEFKNKADSFFVGKKESDSEDDLLVKKPKKDDDSDEERPAVNKTPKSKLNVQSDVDILNQIYGAEAKDKTDLFLRDYILN